MFGLETLHFEVPWRDEGSPRLVARKFGPKRSSTREHNTTISAIESSRIAASRVRRGRL